MDRGYGKSHVWVEKDRVGITQHASDELHGIVYVTIDPGVYKKGDAFGTIESTKAAEELIAPCDMTVVEINETIETNPEALDTIPETVSIASVKDVNMSGLMTKEEYLKWLECQN